MLWYIPPYFLDHSVKNPVHSWCHNQLHGFVPVSISGEN